jgi:hypothetical protein
MAYPENLVNCGKQSDSIDYAFIHPFETEISWDDKCLALPTFRKGETITLVIATGASVIHDSSLDLTINQSVLDGRGQIDAGRLTEKQKSNWKSLRRRLKAGVAIEFLFTASP